MPTEPARPPLECVWIECVCVSVCECVCVCTYGKVLLSTCISFLLRKKVLKYIYIFPSW